MRPYLYARDPPSLAGGLPEFRPCLAVSLMTPSSSERWRAELLERLDGAPASVTFGELQRLCVALFGEGRRGSGSHLIFRTGLPELPIVNIQPRGKMAKPYQCRQVAKAARAQSAKRGD